jgi:hypothetical protein
VIDLGQFTPTATLAPMRSASGTVLGRFTTTDEQKAEALEWMAAGAKDAGEREVQATIIWSRGEPTVLVAEFNIEHLGKRRVWLVDRYSERTLNGAEISQDEGDRLRMLRDETRELHDKGML